MKKLIALCLALTMLLCCLGCSGAGSLADRIQGRTAESSAAAKDTFTDIAEKLKTRFGEEIVHLDTVRGWPDHVPYADMEHGDVDYDTLSYRIWTVEDFEASCQRLLDADSADGVIDAFEKLYADYVDVDSNYTICYIEYCKNVTDEQLVADQAETERVLNECWDKYCGTVRDTLAGPQGKVLAAYLTEDVADAFREYEDQSEHEQELRDQENALVARYYEEMDDPYSYTFSYRGKDWNLEALQEDMGRTLGYTGWYAVRDGIYGAINAVVGKTYLELLAIRAELAEINGYDNYAEYAYEGTYSRDYTPEDAQVLCDTIKQYVGPSFYDDLYGNDLLYEDLSCDMSGEEMFRLVGQYCGQLAPAIREAWEYLYDHNLYYITDDDRMMDAGYTTTISKYHAPFVFICMGNTLSDISTVAHEFGHACDAYWNQPRDEILDHGCYDVFEIHSTGMEIMLTRYYSEVMGDRAAAAEFNMLFNLVYSVVSGCLFDEFQRKIYADPTMTLDEINQLYYDLCVAYGESEPTDHDYYWCFVPHTFSSPCYYVSYAASALGTIQIWDLQQKDPDAALALYLDILGKGAYDYGYTELMEAAGLKSFGDKGAADEICRPLIDYLRHLS